MASYKFNESDKLDANNYHVWQLKTKFRLKTK
jgi:hypothetical protein